VAVVLIKTSDESFESCPSGHKEEDSREEESIPCDSSASQNKEKKIENHAFSDRHLGNREEGTFLLKRNFKNLSMAFLGLLIIFSIIFTIAILNKNRAPTFHIISMIYGGAPVVFHVVVDGQVYIDHGGYGQENKCN